MTTEQRDRASGRILGILFEDRPELAAYLFGREPRYRYFTGARGEMYCWTIERADEGKYWAMEYRPVGPGSRSGAATEWKLVRRVGFKLRRAAKARALKWWRAAQ